MYETIDQLYSGEVDIFKIQEYLAYKYNDLIEVYWEVDGEEEVVNSIWGRLFRGKRKEKKSGYRLEYLDNAVMVSVEFFDKKRETLEALEEELSKDKKFELYRLLKGINGGILLERAINVDIEEGKIVISLLEEDVEGDEFLGKLVRFFKDKAVKRLNCNGVGIYDLVYDADKFGLILGMMSNME